MSHSGKGDIVDKHGFIIDKTQKPAKVYAKNINNGIIDDVEIKIRKSKKRKYNARKVDFEKINEENTVLGDAGGRFALDWERKRLKKLGVAFNVLDEVIHVSKRYGDGCGYDILSKNIDGSPRFIVVKTTKNKSDTPFCMSQNGKSFMEEYRENAVVYRLYNFIYDRNIAKVLMVTQDDLEHNYCSDPLTFKVIKK